MANGTYGIKKPATINPSDVEILYSYKPTRGSESPEFKGFKTIDADSVLNKCKSEDGITEISGLYNLRLPLEIFKNKGFYTIYIKPKETDVNTIDVSTLTGDYANVRGIVFNVDNLSSNNIQTENGSLVGYRIEYPNGEYRIITSSNRCEPVSQNASNQSSIQKGIRYRFNDSSDLIFCTVTPSTAASFKSTALPYIGMPGESVKLVNTKFNPVMIEVEMTNHDIDTVSTMLEGAQVRNLDNGIITTFDEDGNIYHQAAYGNIVKANEDMHADFKIPYDENYESSEKEKFEEIVNQVRNA